MRLFITSLVVAGLALTGTAQASYSVKVEDRTLIIKGDRASDRLALRASVAAPDTLAVDVGDNGSANFEVALNRFDRIRVSADRGDDLVRIDESANELIEGIPTTLAGQRGRDTLLGGAGSETLTGGRGADLVDGNGGEDVGILGAGRDRFVWDPGDASDVVEGGLDRDTLTFNGSNADEAFDVSANGPRVRFFRNIGDITMDLRGVDRVDVAALDGADTLTLGDLSGTDLHAVNGDLAAAPGGTTADGQPDRAIVTGTNADDAIVATGAAGSVSVTGLSSTLRLTNSNPAQDTLTVNSLAGSDDVSAAGLAADSVDLTADGGLGNDEVLGSAGADVLRGSQGDDSLDGNGGGDAASLGAGDDLFTWDPGDGSDAVEGEAGRDAMAFNGANVDETFDVSANGGRVLFVRNIANITMDLDGVERVDTRALGGADTVTVRDLSGTDLRQVDTDLSGELGSSAGDGQIDQLIVNGTNGNDAIEVAGADGTVDVTGLAASARLTNAEAANDRLTVNGLGGTDTIDTSGLAPNTIGVTFNQ